VSKEIVKRHWTSLGYDNLWVFAINGVLEDRGTSVRIDDLNGEFWDRFIGPMIDRIEDEGGLPWREESQPSTTQSH
jgi:hypothetical protein